MCPCERSWQTWLVLLSSPPAICQPHPEWSMSLQVQARPAQGSSGRRSPKSPRSRSRAMAQVSPDLFRLQVKAHQNSTYRELSLYEHRSSSCFLSSILILHPRLSWLSDCPQKERLHPASLQNIKINRHVSQTIMALSWLHTAEAVCKAGCPDTQQLLSHNPMTGACPLDPLWHSGHLCYPSDCALVLWCCLTQVTLTRPCRNDWT